MTLNHGPNGKPVNITASPGQQSGTKGDTKKQSQAPSGTKSDTKAQQPSGTKGDSGPGKQEEWPGLGPGGRPASGTPTGVVSEDPQKQLVPRIPPGDPDPDAPFQRRPMVGGVPSQAAGH